MKFLNAISIRKRLLVVYVTIILLGFGGLALVTGEQISSGAQVDYGQSLQNEIVLIAQGVGSVVESYVNGQIDQNQLNTALQKYETQVNGTLTLYQPSDIDALHANRHGSYHDPDELESALRGKVSLVESQNDAGEATFYTAAPVVYDETLLGLLQLSVPARNIQEVVTERWLELALLFALVGGVAVLAALGLARSIVRPLYKLRESALRLSKGDFSHRVSYEGRDEIGEVARAFNEMAQQVESMLEEQRSFASNTSHELRTPLTTIRQRTEALRYDLTLDQAISRRYIEQIDDEVIRLGNLVEELTLLSRLDAGRPELGREQVDMLRFASNLQEQMSALAKDKNIQISLVLPAQSVLLNARLDHVTVVFRNLLDNAIKYTPKGGIILWNIEQGEQGVNSNIRDPGLGIDALHLPHLFERFYRADKAHSRTIPGTGLGLALVKSIVEAYGGHVSIESSGVDQGTIVSIFWPYFPEAGTS